MISSFKPGFLGFRVDSLRLTVEGLGMTIRGLRALSRVHLSLSCAILCYCDVQVALIVLSFTVSRSHPSELGGRGGLTFPQTNMGPEAAQ